MKKRLTLIACALSFTGALPAVTAQANELNYTYIEASYSHAPANFQSDSIEDSTFSGAGIVGSLALTKYLVVGGGFNMATTSTTALFQNAVSRPIDVEVTGPTLFALLHTDINELMDVQIGVRFNRISVQGLSGDVALEQLSYEEDSRTAFTGLRFQLTDAIELHGTAGIDVDADNTQDSLHYAFGGRINLSTNVQAEASVSPDADGNEFGVSIRHNF